MAGALVAKRKEGKEVYLQCRCCHAETTLSLGNLKAFSALGDYLWAHRHVEAELGLT